MALEAEWDWGRHNWEHSDLRKKRMDQGTRITMSGDGLWGKKKTKNKKTNKNKQIGPQLLRKHVMNPVLVTVWEDNPEDHLWPADLT